MTRNALAFLAFLAPSVALAEDVELQPLASADFSTKTDPAAVERVACALGARAQIEGADRPLDMRVEYDGKVVLCPSAGKNAFTVVVRIEPAQAGGGTLEHVMVIADPPNAEARKDLEPTIKEIAAELERRSRGATLQQRVDVAKAPEIHARPTRAFSPALTITGIVVAALGFGALGAGYFWLAGESVRARDLAPPVGTMLAGGGGILMGALFALVGEHRVPAEPTSGTLVPGGFRF